MHGKSVRLNVFYWEDPVYRYVSRLCKQAHSISRPVEAARLAELMQRLVSKSLPDNIYFMLDVERRQAQKQQKQERKKKQRDGGRLVGKKNSVPAVNVAELKKRVFNPQTSQHNMIRALEAMPADERGKTIENLTSFLRSKIVSWLKKKGY